jgi:hypothetical protein
MIFPVEVSNIPSTQALHHCGNTSKLCTRHEHMNVVGHKNICVYEAIIFIGNLLQGGEIKSPVFISSKTRRPVNAALD